jgi:hypothetical protein
VWVFLRLRPIVQSGVLGASLFGPSCCHLGRAFFSFLDLSLVLRWHPLYVAGLLALPLCGAAVTFFAAAKKVTKESSFKPSVPARQTLRHTIFELSHHSRQHSGSTT